MGLLEAHANLAGKVAAIIGGAGGIGRGVTLGLAKAGVHIATCDIDEQATHNIVSEVEALGLKIIAAHCDVRDVRALDNFYDRVEATFERLDIVVNVAGGVKRSPFLKATRDQDAADIRLNYGYVVDSVRRAIPLIRKGGRGGSIINFTTIEAHRGAATFGVYAGAKAATTNFSRAIAVEFGAERIRVNLVAPDTTPARGSYNSLYPEDLERLAGLGETALAQCFKMIIPQQQAPSVEDLVDAVLFLACDLSRSITGITLHVDGGTMAASGFNDWPFGDGFMGGPLGGTLKRLFASGKGNSPESP